MSNINGVMLSVSNSPVASIVAKATVSTALGLLAAWLARGNRAAIRHALLAAMFGVLLLLPVATMVMPAFHVTVPVGIEGQPLLVPSGFSLDASPSATALGGSTGVNAAAPFLPGLSISTWLLIGWVAGAAFTLFPMVVGLWQIRPLRQSGLPFREGQLLVERLSAGSGIHRRIEILMHEAAQGPMTYGLLRPVILLPKDAENWSQEDLTRALIHELEHVRRGDWQILCLARIATAFYWFHLLVWIAWRKLVLEAERSCDDAVLRRSDATAYADQLVALAKRLSVAQRSPMLAMANSADLATRVGAVLDSRQRRGRAGRFSVTLSWGAAAALLLAVSPVIFVGAPQPSERPSFEVASIKMSTGHEDGVQHFGPQDVELTRTNLLRTIADAYEIPYTRIVPPRTSSNQKTLDTAYDISAKANHPVPKSDLLLMLQSLFEDRFKLAVHHESRTEDVYQLVVAKGGPKLEQSTDVGPATGILIQNGYRMKNIEIWRFCAILSGRMGRPVIDETGLTGTYNFELRLDTLEGLPGSDPNLKTKLPDWSSSSIFSDIRKQLGLQLVPAKGPVDYLVIDRLENPSDN